jgi:hypothetical protein
MSLVIDASFESGWSSQPDLYRRTSMAALTPLARYSAVEGALASGFVTAAPTPRAGTRPQRLLFAAAESATLPSLSTIQRVADIELNIAAIENTLAELPS